MANLNNLLSQFIYLIKFEANFTNNLEQRLQASCAKLEISAKWKFISAILLGDEANNAEAIVGVQTLLQNVIKVACDKGLNGTKELVKAIEACDSPALIADLQSCIKKEFGLDPQADLSEALGDLSVVEVAREPGPDFFHRAPPLHDMEKVATFNFPTDSDATGTISVVLSQDALIGHFEGNITNKWAWGDNEEKTIKIGQLLPRMDVHITFYDIKAEFTIVGTNEGDLHFVDSTTKDKVRTVPFGRPIISVVSLGPTFIVRTGGGDDDDGETFWKLEVPRPLPQVLKMKAFADSEQAEARSFYLDSLYVYIGKATRVEIYNTASAKRVRDENNNICWLQPPSDIRLLTTVNLVSTTGVVVAACEDGAIALWTTRKLSKKQQPIKVLQGHEEAVISVLSLAGHLLSLDESGKLLIWSAHDLEREHIVKPVPRLLTADFGHMVIMDTYENWFAAGCTDENEIQIWTLPDSWLLSG